MLNICPNVRIFRKIPTADILQAVLQVINRVLKRQDAHTPCLKMIDASLKYLPSSIPPKSIHASKLLTVRLAR